MRRVVVQVERNPGLVREHIEKLLRDEARHVHPLANRFKGIGRCLPVINKLPSSYGLSSSQIHASLVFGNHVRVDVLFSKQALLFPVVLHDNHFL